jgi:hypothetical protein
MVFHVCQRAALTLARCRAAAVASCPVSQLPVLRRIVAEEGMAAIWRGMKPRVLFNAPAAAISWGTYESVKELLLRDKEGQRSTVDT